LESRSGRSAASSRPAATGHNYIPAPIALSSKPAASAVFFGAAGVAFPKRCGKIELYFDKK